MTPGSSSSSSLGKRAAWHGPGPEKEFGNEDKTKSVFVRERESGGERKEKGKLMKPEQFR